MKRRQVITGLLALGAIGTLPYAARRSIEGGEQQVRQDMGSVLDIDPPLFEPLSDHEHRHVVNPNNTIEQRIQQSIADMIGSSPATSAVHSSNILLRSSPSVLSKTTIESVAEPQPSIDALAHTVDVQSANIPATNSPTVSNQPVNKAIYFEQDYDDDIVIHKDDRALLHSVHLRLKKLQSQIGYGHFNILNFDDALTFAKRFDAVGAFTPKELAFIEKIFTTDAAEYGFYGEKVISSLTDNIRKQHTFKVPHTGHYLFKDQSLAYYEKLQQHVGEGIILTSGIRSNVKQLHLFLAKVVRVNGNLSRASRSLAPPGYSYHGVGDFDVGRKGWGGKNFTDAFSQTDEFKKMLDLGYVAIRYDEGNNLGVRFEPWHIKVV